MDIKQQADKHKALYDQIPKVDCIPGCYDCCSSVAVSDYEARKLNVTGRYTATRRNTKMCIYSSKTGCTRHDDRPFMCRLFAASEATDLQCPRGAQAPKPLSVDETDRLVAEYIPIVEIY